MKPLISVIFSFRNEELVLPELIRRVQTVFESIPFDYELIFANDASADHSMEILLAARQKNPRIKILQMSRRWGVMPCFMAGFDHASGDAVIMMDSDLQDPPEVIPQLITKWQVGAQIVHSVRTKRKGESFLKKIVTALGYRIWKLLIPVDLLLDSGDFRLLSKAAVNEVVKFRARNPFFRGITRSLKFKQDFIVYEREKRYAGETHFPLLGSLNPIKTFLSAIISFSPSPTADAEPLYMIESKHGFPEKIFTECAAVN